MNYNTVMTAGGSIPCSQKEYEKIKAMLDELNDSDESTGIDCEWDEKDGIYFFGEEVALVENLSGEILKKIGQLLKKAKVKHLELGLAFTASKLAPESHGGTYVRILQSGELVSPKLVWPKQAE